MISQEIEKKFNDKMLEVILRFPESDHITAENMLYETPEQIYNKINKDDEIKKLLEEYVCTLNSTYRIEIANYIDSIIEDNLKIYTYKGILGIYEMKNFIDNENNEDNENSKVNYESNKEFIKVCINFIKSEIIKFSKNV